MTGWHVLWIALGAIGIVVLVNIFFVFAALRSHSGVDVGDAYTLGLAYNDHIAERERQAALGWSAEVAAASTGPGQIEITISLVDAEGLALSGLALGGELRRVVESRSDQAISFTERAPGTYVGFAQVAFPGRWEGRFHAEDLSGRRFDFEDVLWLE